VRTVRKEGREEGRKAERQKGRKVGSLLHFNFLFLLPFFSRSFPSLPFLSLPPFSRHRGVWRRHNGTDHHHHLFHPRGTKEGRKVESRERRKKGGVQNGK
jgi:hypothetical protein